MALTYTRFLGHNQLSGCTFNNICFKQLRCITIKSTAATPPIKESHDEKNVRLNRPQSPHITVYKFQLPANLSITHRITGAALAVYMSALGIGSLVAPHNFPDYITMLQDIHLSPFITTGAKALIAFPFAYHYCNGIRHLIWDTGRALTIKEVYLTGYVMLGSALLLTTYLLTL